MRVIVFNPGKSLNEIDAFSLVDQITPEPSGHDLLVKIEAIGLNPVDTKIRQTLNDPESTPRILGWDAAGVVEAVGDLVTLFEPGDRVFYAGDVTRPGCYASHQLVDERITGRCPQKLTAELAAAMPLTSITAWEALFDRMKINPAMDTGKHLLIIGAGGGLGSVAIQLASQVAGLTVTATASKQESRNWVRTMGANHVINHREDMASQLKELGLQAPDYILCLAATDHYFPIMADIIAPQGMICAVVSAAESYDMNLLKNKSVGFVWEFMFTRSMFNTADMIRQHDLLNEISRMLDEGTLKSTARHKKGIMSPESIREAHRELESGGTVGKIVMKKL